MNEAQLPRLLQRKYRSDVVRDDYPDGSPGYLASHPELEGCIAVGGTPQEALAELERARDSYIRALVKAGVEVPTPAPLPELPERIPMHWNWMIFGSPDWPADGFGLQRVVTDLGEVIAHPLGDPTGAG